MTISRYRSIEPAILFSCVVLGLLAGCAAGPEFSPPAPPMVRSLPSALERSTRRISADTSTGVTTRPRTLKRTVFDWPSSGIAKS